jgi:multidrug efflux pump subunit AcrA (membrane-fusion protein)
MYAAVSLCCIYAEDVLAVPKKALYNDGGSYYVYQVVNGERVRRDVEIGVSTRLKVEITQGLREGDEIYVQQ